MAGYYEYLLSSLPMLHFGAKPPVSFEVFQAACRGLVSDEESALLEAAGRRELSPFPFFAAGEEKGRCPLLRAWVSFERMLRNELAKVRAGRLHQDATGYLRGEEPAEPLLTHVAVNAMRQPDILEAERMLDARRWEWLEAQSLGHYFDADALMIYALKLLILERWHRVRQTDTDRLLGGMNL